MTMQNNEPTAVQKVRNQMKESKALAHISDMEHGVIAVVGSGKQGKSASLHSLISLCQPDRKVTMLDPMEIDMSIFPDSYRHAKSIKDVDVGDIVVIEDVNRVFHSRGSGKDATLQRWLGIISHRSNLVCFTSQSLAATDLEFMRSQDTVIVNKYMHPTDLVFERESMVPTQTVANEWIDIASKDSKADRRSWCFFPNWNELISIPLVDWWGFRHSHMLRDVVL